MHAGAIPIDVGAERFAVKVDVHTVLFAKTHEEVTGDPHLIGGLFGAFAEDLEFPLAFGDFGVDAFVVDARIEAKIKMSIDDLTGQCAHGLITHACVVFALRRWEATAFGKAQRNAVLVQKVFLLKTEPRI